METLRTQGKSLRKTSKIPSVHVLFEEHIETWKSCKTISLAKVMEVKNISDQWCRSGGQPPGNTTICERILYFLGFCFGLKWFGPWYRSESMIQRPTRPELCKWFVSVCVCACFVDLRLLWGSFVPLCFLCENSC